MLHSTRVVLVMLAVITKRRAKHKVRDHNQWFGRCLPIPPVKSILETTADSGIAALHRGGRAAIYGRVAQHERMSPFRAGACRAKARRSTESLMRALKGTPWYSSELDHARSHCDGHHLHGSRVFITCPSEFRSNILHYNRNLETHTFIP